MSDSLVSAKIILNPRKRRRCEDCGYFIDGPQLRLYGAASDGDPKFTLYAHPECVTWEHPKILAAKAALRQVTVPEPIVIGHVHDLKCWPKFFRDIITGMKTFELRKDDREYCVGDFLHLQEWNPETEQYTGKEITVRVTYALRDFPGIADGYVLMGIR